MELPADSGVVACLWTSHPLERHKRDPSKALREHLKVDRWLVTGGSWGATLAVAYAECHPTRVSGVVLAAITTTDRPYVDWITETVAAIYPEAWDRLATHAEQAGIGYKRGKGRLVEAYARLMTDDDPVARDEAARAWTNWEDHHISVGTGKVVRDPCWDDVQYRQIFATLVTHYWSHDAFLSPPILEELESVQGIPATLIHGRRDVSGPTVGAWRMHRAWSGSELIVIEDEGHGGPSMTASLCDAIGRHADRISAVTG